MDPIGLLPRPLKALPAVRARLPHVGTRYRGSARIRRMMSFAVRSPAAAPSATAAAARSRNTAASLTHGPGTAGTGSAVARRAAGAAMIVGCVPLLPDLAGSPPNLVPCSRALRSR